MVLHHDGDADVAVLVLRHRSLDGELLSELRPDRTQITGDVVVLALLVGDLWGVTERVEETGRVAPLVRGHPHVAGELPRVLLVLGVAPVDLHDQVDRVVVDVGLVLVLEVVPDPNPMTVAVEAVPHRLGHVEPRVGTGVIDVAVEDLDVRRIGGRGFTPVEPAVVVAREDETPQEQQHRHASGDQDSSIHLAPLVLEGRGPRIEKERQEGSPPNILRATRP